VVLSLHEHEPRSGYLQGLRGENRDADERIRVLWGGGKKELTLEAL
jgi:hypothetical protein